MGHVTTFLNVVSEFPPDDPNLSLFQPSFLWSSSGTFLNVKFGMGKITIWKYLLFLYSVKGVSALFVRCTYMFPV